MQLKQYAVDEKLAEEGRRVPLGPDSYITVAKFGNRKFQEMFRKLTAPYGKRVDRIPAEEQERIYLECVAKTIVLDWGGIMDGDREIPYSHENVVDVFKRYPDFHSEVLELSKELATFQTEDMQEDLGNSETPSEPNSG